jgi:hypothetical protein
MRSQDGGKGRALRNDRDASFSARAASTPIAVSIRSGAVYGNGSDSMSVDGTLLRISLDRRRSIASVAIAFVTLAIGAPAASSGGTSRPPPWASKGFLVYKCGDSLCLSRPDGGARRELLRTPRPPYPQMGPGLLAAWRQSRLPRLLRARRRRLRPLRRRRRRLPSEAVDALDRRRPVVVTRREVDRVRHERLRHDLEGAPRRNGPHARHRKHRSPLRRVSCMVADQR